MGSLTVRTSISRGTTSRVSAFDDVPSSTSCRVRFLPLPKEGEGGVEDGVVETISGFALEEYCESWEDEEDIPVGSEGDFALMR